MENNTISKHFIFQDFISAIEYIHEMSIICEEINHHPDWRNVYNNLYIILTTHDAKNTITQKDITLAKKMNLLFEKWKLLKP